MVIIACFSIIISVAVIAGWYLNIKEVLVIIPGASSMKLNTALGFLLSGIGLLAVTKKSNTYLILQIAISLLLFFLGTLTLVQYNFGLNLNIDNFFVYDMYSSKFPGRMSPATATCYALIGISFGGLTSKYNFVKNITQYILFTVTLISLVSIVTYILNVPSQNKTFFWSSMAIHTSILFLVLSVGISLKNSTLGFTGLITGQLAGSKLIRVILPYLIILPLTLSYLLITLFNRDHISIDFAISVYTVIFILLSICFISVIALAENKDDLYRNKLEKSLKEKNEELEQYTYTVSHDLQEPLRSITSLIKLFEQESKSKLNKDETQYLSLINQATGRMSILIKDLLNFSKVGKNGKLELVDCNKLINLVQDDLVASIKENNVIIKVNKLPSVMGYQIELRLLFQNIISNAIKFMPADKKPEISISAQREKDFWKFSITDNGIGIAVNQQQKIFEIFQRLHAKSEYEGTGIGLAHCQKVVTLHGGTIWVVSQLNEGSTFYFTIPA